MSPEALYALLPSIHRLRDAEEGYPLRALVAVLARGAAILEEHIEQLHDDQFIETCADWVAPYIGGLIGHRPLHGVVPRIASPRAEVANTIRYRRRLGTASVLEQLARDVTGWPARVVEYFLLTATTQRMSHIRPAHHLAPDLRRWRGLEALGGAFDPFTRLPDMRPIQAGEGRHNFPNVGIHLWRLEAFARTAAPADALDAARHRFSPLGAPVALVTRPVVEEEISQLATPLNVPGPITRRALHADLAGEAGQPGPRALYGRSGDGALQSLLVTLDGAELGPDEVEACNLSDVAGGWANMPAAGERIAVDPVLGRVALPPDRLGAVTVSYHHAFSAPIGGGEYERAADFAAATPERPLIRVPADQPTPAAALAVLPAEGGIVEILDNRRYDGALAIAAGAGAFIELRAANGANPHLALPGDLPVTGAADARVVLDGLLVSGGAVIVPAGGGNALAGLTLRHMTLVPGRALDAEGQPVQPGAPSLVIAADGLALAVAHSILGAMRVGRDSTARLEDSILDAAAGSPAASGSEIAYAAPDDAADATAPFGGPLTLLGVTVFGKLAATRFDLVSNSLLAAALAPADLWPAPVWAERRQVGCMRFSFVPMTSRVPRRFRCQPQQAIDDAIAAREATIGGPIVAAERARITASIVRRLVPGFTARRYGRAAYAQLRDSAPAEVRGGAEDEGEMGAFHLLFAPQRAANLRIRTEEYLRFALAAGAFHES
jgi:hypothetical protein